MHAFRDRVAVIRRMNAPERYEQLIAFLGSQLPAPVEQEPGDAGAIIFTGGAPGEVVVHLTEVSVVVSVSCPHRAEAFAACRWGIDELKESVPIWKKEHASDGSFWIEGDQTKPVA